MLRKFCVLHRLFSSPFTLSVVLGQDSRHFTFHYAFTVRIFLRARKSESGSLRHNRMPSRSKNHIQPRAICL